MTSNRGVSASVELATLLSTRQFQREGGTAAEAVAVRGQRSAQLLGGQGTAVQAKSVSGLARREPMSEEAAHRVGADAHTIVDYGNSHSVVTGCDADRYSLVWIPRVIASILCIADEIDEDLQHLVLVDTDLRHRAFDLADDRYAVARECGGIHPQTVFDEGVHGDDLGNAAELGVALLHCHRLFDVIDAVSQGAKFL